MVTWKFVYTNQALKDAKKLSLSVQKFKALEILKILENDLFHKPLPCEKLVGNISGAFSCRISI